jgi:hypothetical protein
MDRVIHPEIQCFEVFVVLESSAAPAWTMAEPLRLFVWAGVFLA